jgi:uncharacterized protein YndB with AHSA1/START domain
MTIPWTYQHTWTIAATPARVFEALTRAPHLERWFAEHAEGASAAGAPFRFWGRHTLGQPGSVAATQMVTRLEPDSALAFTWRIGASDTEVAIALGQADSGTTLTLTHHMPTQPTGRRAKELIDDHWRLAMGNLMAHLADGDGIVLPDYGDPSPTVRFSLFVDAAPAVVFRALTEPALINQWFLTDASVVDLRVGGRYQTNWRYQVDGRDVVGGPTKILELVPGRRLVLDWPDWRGDETVAAQTITFDLAPEGSGTRLTFLHAGFERPSDVSDYPFGWTEFLSQLAAIARKA